MQSENQTYQIYNYPDIFSEYFFCNRDNECTTCPEYTLIFVFSGELFVQCTDCEKTVRKGEYLFLRKDESIVFTRKSYGEELFRSVFMGFNQNFLCEFHKNMKNKEYMKNGGDFKQNIIELPRNAYLQSMYVSLLPYLEWNMEPMKQIVEIKLMEAVFSLLLTDKRFYTCLFGFTEECNEDCCDTDIDCIIRNMNAGSLIGDMLPIQCLLSKKPETAYIRLDKNSDSADIYMEANYKEVAGLMQRFGNCCDSLHPN